MDVFDLVAKLTLDSSEYDSALGSAEKSAGGFSTIFGATMAGVGTAAAGGVAALAAVGTATVGATKAIIDGAADVAAYGDNIDKMSQKMGISIEAYQEWDAVMQHSGTSMESMKASMKTLANAVETGNEAFERLGLSQEELQAMSQQELFETTIAGLQNMTDETERMYVAGKLLGRGATELGALLNTSAEDTQAMRDRVRELGGVMSEDAVKSAANFTDNLQDLTTSMESVKRNITAELLPGLSSLMDGFTRLISGDADAGDAIEEGIEKLLEGISNAGGKILDIVTKVFPQVIAGIAEKFPELVSRVVGLVSEIAPEILNALGTVVLPTILQALPPILSMLFEVIPPLFFDMINIILEFLPELLTLAVTLITTLADGISQALPELVPTIVSVILEIVNTLLGNLDKIVEAALQILTALIQGIANALPQLDIMSYQIIFEIVGALIRMLPAIIEAAVTIISTLVGYLVSEGISLINGDTFKRLLDALLDVWDTIDWGSIGKNIIQGIINGLTSGWNNMKDAVSGLVQKIKDVFTNGFKISSPSKVFEYYGQMIDAGLEKGIEDDTDKTSAAAAGLIKGVSIKPAGGGMSGDIIIPVYLGTDLLQTITVDALSIANYRSGGRE